MKRVLLGMSGGVDSSVAAYLLKKEGYEVVGVTMKLFLKKEDKSVEDAISVCKMLGIEHHTVEYTCAFQKYVIDNFIENYKTGKTPNPCIECNKYLKFGLLWEEAKKLNCEYIATGHYANKDGSYIKKMDSNKDQSYFLYGIKKEIIPHILFPLANYPDKEEIRKIASELNLVVKDKKDSQDICFIENNNYKTFLKEKNIENKEGLFLLKDGTIIGKHKGITNYTIGQRKGLGISYETPLYVISIDALSNTILLGQEQDLYKKEVIITNINSLVDKFPTKATAKVRYKAKLEECEIKPLSNNEIKIIFKNKVKSITPGQSLVLYDQDIVLGGGIIK